MNHAADGLGGFSVPKLVAGLAAALAAVAGLAGCAPAAGPGGDLRREAMVVLTRALNYGPDPAVRAQATEAAAAVLDKEIADLVRDALTDEHRAVRFAACMALGKAKDIRAMPEIRRLSNDPDPSVRAAAYFALERLGIRSYRKEWADLLFKHEDPVVRRNAALAVGRLQDKSVKPLLDRAFASDEDEGVRLQALEGLALLGDRGAIAQFIRDAYGGVGYRQPFALLTLARVRTDEALIALRGRLASSPYIEARLAAARGLGMWGYGEGFELAQSSLTWNEPDPGLLNDPPANQVMRVRTMAALALGEIRDQRALGPLRQLMVTDGDPRVQLAAATAILMILNEPPAEPAAPGAPREPLGPARNPNELAAPRPTLTEPAAPTRRPPAPRTPSPKRPAPPRRR